jgi:hypothetical protein
MRVPVQIEMLQQGQVLKRFENQIAALGDTRARIAMSRAINRATRTTYTAVTRALQMQTSAPRAVIRREVGMTLSAQQGAGALQGVIWSHGKELPLSVFNPSQFSYGVRAKVWGRMQRFEHAFIFKGSWRTGDPIAQGSGGAHVFIRNGRFTGNKAKGENRNNGFAEMFGPSLPKEMVKDATLAAFHKVARQQLEARLQHELGRMLGV